MVSDRDAEEEAGYALQPEEGEGKGPAPTSAGHLLRKAEAEVAAEREAQRSSADLMKESLGGWWNKAKDVAAGWGRGAKTLAEAGSHKAEAATIRTMSLPKAYAALGQAVYENRRHADELAQAYSQLDDLMRQLEQLHAHDTTPPSSLADRAKQSVRRAADAATAKTVSIRIGQQLQRLGAECYGRFGAESGSPEWTATVRGLLSRLDELEERAD